MKVLANTGTSPRRMANAVGLSLLACYLGWNAWWLAHASVPPALLKALTGLPAPTTGGTRSCIALLQGDLGASLYYNPFSIPIVLLLALTVYQACRRGVADAWIGRAWPRLLLVAWVIKLISPRDSW